MESAVTVRRALFGHSRAIIVGLSGPARWGIREAKGRGKQEHLQGSL